jgi:DNA-binding response OmpR family regulator
VPRWDSPLDASSLAAAHAVIYDPVRSNMLTTRTVLHGIGFRRIEGLTSLRELNRRLEDAELSVLFIEASEQSRQMTELIRSLRLGEGGANPFLPVIATLWTGQTDLIADLMNAGSDDVLLRPFSAAQAADRVRALVTNRKPFVITSDYLGPDRGGRETRSGPAPVPFDAPNPLRARVVGEGGNPVEAAEALAEAKRRVAKERLAKLARRIAMAAEVTIQANGRANENTAFIVDLMESAAELVRAAKRLEQDEVQDIAAVLENVVARAASPGPERVENAELTRQLALALYVAYAVDESETFKMELERTLDSVRNRLDKAKDRVRRRQSMSSALLGQ